MARASGVPLLEAIGQLFVTRITAHLRSDVGTYRVNLTTDDELHEWVEYTFGIAVPRVACCHGHVAPFEAFAHAFFARDEVAIWWAARGLGGKTVQLALLALTEVVALGAGVTLLGGSGEQAQRLLAYMQGTDSNFEAAFWDAPNAPRRLVRQQISRRTSLKNGGWLHALMASSRSVRGPHPQRLRIDEADETTQAIVEAALGQPMGREDPTTGRRIGAQAVLSSTWHESQGTMTWLVRKAAPSKGWPVFQWCYKESLEGWLTHEAVNEKRAQMTSRSFAVECDLQEPNPEARVFQPETIAMLFQPRLGEFDIEEDWFGEVILEPPEPGALYGTGTDWAKSVDFTYTFTYRADYKPAELVAWGRWARMPWPLIVEKLDARMLLYGGKSVHDATGVGKVVGDYLKCDSLAWEFVGKKRTDLLSAYIIAAETGELTGPDISLMTAAHEFAAHKDVYGPDHLPDEIAAAACAWKAVQLIRGSDIKGAIKARKKARRRRGSLEGG